VDEEKVGNVMRQEEYAVGENTDDESADDENTEERDNAIREDTEGHDAMTPNAEDEDPDAEYANSEYAPKEYMEDDPAMKYGDADDENGNRPETDEESEYADDKYMDDDDTMKYGHADDIDNRSETDEEVADEQRDENPEDVAEESLVPQTPENAMESCSTADTESALKHYLGTNDNDAWRMENNLAQAVIDAADIPLADDPETVFFGTFTSWSGLFREDSCLFSSPREMAAESQNADSPDSTVAEDSDGPIQPVAGIALKRLIDGMILETSNYLSAFQRIAAQFSRIHEAF
jgi:hypothetical protein